MLSFRSALFTCLASLFATGFSQDNISHIFFANQTRLSLSLRAVLSGNISDTSLGKISLLPHEITHNHFGNVADIITIGDFLGLPDKDHNETNSSLRCIRTPARGNSFTAEFEVSGNGNKMTTIIIRSEDLPGTTSTRLYYNIRYNDGTTENPEPGLLLTDNGGRQAYESYFTFNGERIKLVYGVFDENQDNTDNILFSFSQPDDYRYRFDPPLSDTADPNILNIWCYNPGILMPLNISDQDENERAVVFYKVVPKNMDIVVFQEFFEPRKVRTILEDLRPHYPYQTGKHNRILIPGIGKEGGVRIISKYPILEEKQISYSENGCTPEDFFSQFANKGVKYARISKQGQIVHVFGTHTSVQPCDLYIMGEFIADMNIPQDETVIMAGDFNVDLNRFDPNNGEDVYSIMLDTLNALEPTFRSFLNDRSYKGTTSGLNHFYCCSEDGRQHLDYIFASSGHKVPYLLTNQSQMARLNEPDESFGIFDMGDHEPVYGRIEFPALSVKNETIENCLNNTIVLQTSIVRSAPGGIFQWYKNNNPIPGANGPVLSVSLNAAEDFAAYTCRYQYIYLPDTAINNFFDSSYMNYQWIFRGTTEGSVSSRFDIIPSDSGATCYGIPLPVKNNYRKIPMSLSPNPAKDVIEVISLESLSDYTFQIRDIMGRQTQVFPVFAKENIATIDIEAYVPGTYFITCLHGADRFILPFIKTR